MDGILVIVEEPRKHMELLQSSYTVREDTIQQPDQYLGTDIGKTHFPDGTHAWTMGSTSYIRNAVKNVKACLKDDGYRFNPKLSDTNYSAKTPFSCHRYRPELDISIECIADQTQLFQNVIGILH